MIELPVCDEGSDADDRVVDVLREFVADGLADFHVGLADKVVGGCEPAEVGHSLQVPDDDARFHTRLSMTCASIPRNTYSILACVALNLIVNEHMPRGAA